MTAPAIILGDRLLRTRYGKTAHGLLRKSDRFSIVGVVEAEGGGGDAGDLIDASPLGIPITPSVESAVACAREKPTWAIIGIATSGGRMSAALRNLALAAAQHGLSLVSGLHDYLGDHADIVAAANANRTHIVDLRKPKKPSEMSYWTGNIYKLATARVAVLGTDCIVGKRTTANMIVSGLRSRQVACEMIYTGQTGWLQGADYGFILDATINDFVSGQMEAALIACARDRNPDVMIIEGQSSMQNPSAPCGAEIILSGAIHGVVLQHVPGRKTFSSFGPMPDARPSLESEIAILSAYAKPLLGICLNLSEATSVRREPLAQELAERYHVPIVAPFLEPIDPILESIEALMSQVRARCGATAQVC
jgi:uncharacterized NAD-dependent epimerase/dehydratase family protein